ncbi:MAG: iron-sulfur cluster assembly scaffold protein [Candidatus Aenigmarchaeota archaeon]|nr:iron-sulfur cluster assembly scaffold protein [Candidatus Aenigmarchaeota archaeon]
MYSEKVIEHYKHPHNRGKMENPDGIGEAGAPCGDFTTVFIKVGEKDGKKFLERVMFETVGCIAAVATASLVTEVAEGKTLEEAEKMGKDEILEDLGGLPEIKMHCSALATDALREAIKNYKTKVKE